MIYCIAEFKPKEGREEELFNKLKALEEPTHKEEGCVFYKVMKKFKNCNAEGDHYPILFNEQWRSEKDFDEHCAKPYIVKFFQEECLDKNGSVKEYEVSVYK